MKHQQQPNSGYHWIHNNNNYNDNITNTTTTNKKYQNYLALNYPMECRYILGK
jgi:hypothetical protein